MVENSILSSPIIIIEYGSKTFLDSMNGIEGRSSTVQPAGQARSLNNSSWTIRARRGTGTGFILSGHGSDVNGAARNGPELTVVGSVRVRSVTGNADAGYMEATPGVILSQIISGLTWSLSPNIRPATTGLTVFQTGRTTGTTTGTINGTNFLFISGGVMVNQQVQANYHSAGGDSGGPIFFLNGPERQIMGVHVGRMNDLAIFTTIHNAIITLGASLF